MSIQQSLIELRLGLVEWTTQYLRAVDTWLQLLVVLLSFAVARYAARGLRNVLSRAQERPRLGPLRGLAAALARQAVTACWAGMLWLVILIAHGAGWPHRILTLASSLTLAWLVIGIVSRTVGHPAVARTIALVAWTIAALNVLGWLDPTIVVLDQLAIQLGAIRLSVLGALKAVATLGVLLWGATLAAGLIENRLHDVRDFTPSVRVLLGKLSRTVLVTLALVLALASVGIDLTAFAVFSGAIGVGVGFGLQKVVSNLVAGLILLLDKSIKPGDVIAVADSYGRVDSLGARYVAVVTRDGIEHLIPNEELVTNRVENWSHSHNLLRIKTPVGVHYKSDVRKAIALCIEAAFETDRILDEPAPVCLLLGFGASSVDLEIRCWIEDPMNGRANVRSQMLLRVWDKFHTHGIEIPYPQRDVHIQTPMAPRDPSGLEPGAN
jgi:small-conductance mechanosensitive channel